MASFTAGYGPVCTITDNGSDKCRVTFPAWDFDWELYDDIAVDSSHYIYNQNEAESQAITAKGGTESGGYWFDTEETFAGTNWTSSHRYVPTFQAAANDYNTTTLAMAALSAMDILIQWYEDTALNTDVYYQQFRMDGKPFSAYGGLSRQRCLATAVGSNLALDGDLSAATSQIVIRNFMFKQGWSSYVIGVSPTAGQSGAGAKCQRIVLFGGVGIYVSAAAAANVFRFENCIFLAHGYYAIQARGPQEFYYLSAGFGSGNYVFGNYSVANTWTNCVAVYSAGINFYSKTNGTFTTCASIDATGSAGLQNLTPAQLALWYDNDNNSFWPNPRILTTSSLYHAGTPVAGIAKDIDGNTRDASNPSIGAHEGTATAYPSETTPTVPATPAYADPATTRADGQVTLHIVPDDEADVVYARYKLWNPTTETWGAWSAEDEALKVTGTGDIAIGSLTNHRLYRFAIYAKATLLSEWVITEKTPFATVAVTANGVIEAELEIQEAIEFGTLAFTPANTPPEV